MKKYYYFRIILYPQGKMVKDMAFHCTEQQMHKHAFEICQKLDAAGMSFNGKNANHYYELETMAVPSPKQLTALGF